MKVRDIKQYREQILVKRNDIDYNAHCLGEKDEPLLKDFYGSGKNIDNIVGQISKFAKNTQTQIFYEFLQNADDAKASKLAITFNENWFLVVNNGEPFKTDGTEAPGQLRSFLNKEDSEKAFDDESIGKYGLGSKLLYDLLTNQDAAEKKNERLTEAIITNLKSPILFSWASIEQWNELKYWKKNDVISLQDCQSTNAPLLTKILYAYYPAYFQEKKKLRDSTEKELFSASDVESLQSLFFGNENEKNCFFNKQSEFSFEKGTAILIPLGDGVAENLQAAINDTNGNLINRLATSLSFLKNTKKIFINDIIIKPIYKQDYTIEVKYEGKQKDKNGYYQPHTFDVKILLPTEINSIDKNLCNFYQFLPISNETKCLGFIINAEELELIQNRQEVDWDTYSGSRIKIIGEKLIEKLEDISQNDKPLYFHFLKCFVRAKGNFLEEYLENPIKEFLLKNLPTNNNQNLENIAIKSTALNIKPSDVGLDFYWLDESFKDNYGDFKTKFGLNEWSISGLLNEANAENVRDWIRNLSATGYKVLLSELNSQASFPFIKTSEGNVISKSELISSETIIPLTSKDQDLKAIFDAQSIEYTDVALLEFENLLPTIDILERLKKEIEKVKTNLNETQKHTIFKTFKAHFVEKEKELAIFKNRAGDFYKLGQLVKNDIAVAPSGILHDFQIDPTEPYFDEYDGCFMPNDKIWKAIKENWERVKAKINTQNYINAINDLERFYTARTVERNIVNNVYREVNGAFEHNIDWILASDNTPTTPSAVFLRQNLSNLNQIEFDLICNFVNQNTAFNTVEKHIFDAVSGVTFCNWTNITLQNLHNSLNPDNFNIDATFVSILQRIYPDVLTYFIFTEQNNQLFLEKRNGRTQFYSTDNELVTLLEQNNYKKLPNAIYELNLNLNGLKVENDEFANELINNANIGAHRALIRMVSNGNIQTKQNYLNRLQRLYITANNQYRYNDYEHKVITMMSNQGLVAQIPSYKHRIYIDNQQLSTIQYTDTVTVPDCIGTFSLRDLENYDGINLNGVRTNFIDLNTTLFDTAEKPLNLITINSITNGEQVAFLHTQNRSQPRIQYPNVTEVQILDGFSNHNLQNIQAVFTDFTNWIFVENEDLHLLLESERMPDWLRAWFNNDDNKRQWLVRNGLRFDNCSSIKLRRNYNQNITWADAWINDEIGNLNFANKTLEWLSQRQDFNTDFVKNCVLFEQKFVIKHQNLSKYLLVKSQNNWILQNRNHLTRQNTVYYSRIDESTIVNFHERLQQNGVNYLFWIGENPDNQFMLAAQHLCFLLTKEENVNEAALQNCTEWNVDFYQNWKHIYNNQIIKISENDIPAVLELRYNNITIEDENVNECKTVRIDNIKTIYIKGNQNQAKSVLNVLENHLTEAFKGEQDKFVKLQSLFIEELTNQDNGIGEGNINIPDATQEDRAFLEEYAQQIFENREAIQAGHFGIGDGIGNGRNEDGDEVEDDEIPNRAKISGRIGELAMYFWLKNYRGFVVQDDAMQMLPYDLLLQRNGMDFHLEIKTKAGSFDEDGGAIPIFLRQSQKRWIQANNVQHYFLTTISLRDVGIYNFYTRYRDRNLQECEAEIRGALERKMNDDIYKAISKNEFHMRLTSPNNQDDPFS